MESHVLVKSQLCQVVPITQELAIRTKHTRFYKYGGSISPPNPLSHILPVNQITFPVSVVSVVCCSKLNPRSCFEDEVFCLSFGAHRSLVSR